MSPRPPPTPWTALDRALPTLPLEAPDGLDPIAALDCGADGTLGICQWGEDAFMLVRVLPGDGAAGLTIPLTPLMSAGQIREIAEGVLRGDQRVRTWSLALNVLALGSLLAVIPPDGAGERADAESAGVRA